MEKIKEELKSMQSNPILYLANYFSDLNRDVDLFYFVKENEKTKYLEIINKIETIEQEYYNFYQKTKRTKWDDQQIIESLDKQTIDDLKYKIEEKLFLNKSIFFIKDYSQSDNEDFKEEKKTFLLIINNAYLRQCTFENLQLNLIENLNKKILIAYFLRKHPDLNKNIVVFDVVCELKNIYFYKKIIKKIHPSTFNGLINLEVIYFYHNNIEELYPTIFKGLSSLKKINFNGNQITNIHPSSFNGLTNLEEIYFRSNRIKELDPSIFFGLLSLKKIDFYFNQITNLHPSTFNCLSQLEEIWFGGNKIKELDSKIFNGLSSLKRINFLCNRITNLHQSTFNGLTNLEEIYIWYNKTIELDPTTLNLIIY